MLSLSIDYRVDGAPARVPYLRSHVLPVASMVAVFIPDQVLPPTFVAFNILLRILLKFFAVEGAMPWN